MSLSVIGAGFGRTGTSSLKIALEQMGVGRCYHMIEVFPNPAAPAFWERVAESEPFEWEEIFAPFAATVDWPGCKFYWELAHHYPDAKVILTERDPERWYKSCQETIFSDAHFEELRGSPFEGMIKKIVYDTFDGRRHDKDHVIGVYKRHNAEVRKAIPPERLLVYQVSEGWEPLSKFLGLPIPDMPFPVVNTSEDFNNRTGLPGSPRGR